MERGQTVLKQIMMQVEEDLAVGMDMPVQVEKEPLVLPQIHQEDIFQQRFDHLYHHHQNILLLHLHLVVQLSLIHI